MARLPARHQFFALICLLLAVAAAALWVRGRTRANPEYTNYGLSGPWGSPTLGTGDAIAFFAGSGGRAQIVGSTRGRIWLVLTNISCGKDRAWTVLHVTGDFDETIRLTDSTRLNIYPEPPVTPRGTTDVPGSLGFVFVTSQPGAIEGIATSRLVCLIFPDWFLLAIPLVCGSWLLLGRSAQRHRRRARGLCMECGYDLRASPERCPECGAAVMSQRK